MTSESSSTTPSPSGVLPPSLDARQPIKAPPSSLGFSLEAPPLSEVMDEAKRQRRHDLRRDLWSVAYGALFALAGLGALVLVLS